MKDYFDASALAAILLDEPSRVVLDRHLTTLGNLPIVSEFAVAEVSSTVSRLVRTGESTVENAQIILNDLDDWNSVNGQPVSITPSDFLEATRLVRCFDLKLRAPDALHLAICRRFGARMVTLDKTLAHAARAVDVACINPANPSAT